MNRKVNSLVLIGLMLWLAGCVRGFQPTVVPLPSPTAYVPQETLPSASPGATLLPQSSPTAYIPEASPFPQATPTGVATLPGTLEPLSATPTAVVRPTLKASVPGVVVNLRAGPGEMLPILEKLKRGTDLQVITRAPGSQWVQVQAPDGKTGWVLADLLTFDGDPNTLDINQDTNSQWVTGRVTDNQGAPVEGVKLRIYQDYTAQVFEAQEVSGSDGSFNFFLPLDWSGVFSIEISGVMCSSRIVTKNCVVPGTFSNFGRTWVQLPSQEPVQFRYQAPAG